MELQKNDLSKAIKVLLLFIIFLSIGKTCYSQNDPAIRTRDVIYMKDGRVLRGEIIIFQESDGDITFKDEEGRKYSITRKEYEYFIENERINVSHSDTLIINPRKIDEFEISLGMSTLAFEVNGTSDQEYGGNRAASKWYIPYNLRVAGGRYFGRQHYLGLRLDYALGGLDDYVSPALRYKFHFDGYRRNVSWYLTLDGKYERVVDDFLSLEQHINEDGTNASYNFVYRRQAFNNFGLVFGQGIAFILKNKKSISIEFSVFRNYVLSNDFTDGPAEILINRWNSSGVGLAFSYNI